VSPCQLLSLCALRFDICQSHVVIGISLPAFDEWVPSMIYECGVDAESIVRHLGQSAMYCEQLCWAACLQSGMSVASRGWHLDQYHSGSASFS